MEIELHHIGKKFGKDWVVKEINERFSEKEKVAILGPNGSGKSTLLKLISSFIVPSEGKVVYHHNGKEIPASVIFKHIAYAAPYLELIERMTLEELISNHLKFKKMIDNLGLEDVLRLLNMQKHRNKQISSFSSGMKMRVRLALALFSDTSILLLDEPLSNLDKAKRDWYGEMVQKFTRDRLVIVCSNHQEEEYFFCTRAVKLA